jgi:hypothetical protein
MGPLLRGAMDEDEDTEGPKKEASIIASCERDKWPASVLACAASATEPRVHECLDQLPEETLARYGKALEKYSSSRDHDDDDDDNMPSDDTSCEDALAATSLDAWPPAVADETERSLAAKLRGHALQKQCDDLPWDLEARKCIAGRPAAGVDACLGMLGDAGRAGVERTIEEADDLRAKIVKARGKPGNVSCSKVVAVHYGPDKWKGKAPELRGAARKKAIEASKKSLLESCASSWTIEARACVIATDSDACSALGALGVAWGYPAALTSLHVAPTGIAECDEYGAAVVALSNCQAIPQATRTAMLEAFMQAADAWKNLPHTSLEAARSACEAAADATRQALASCP